MADISQIAVGNDTYDIKDTTARNSLGSVLYVRTPALANATGTCNLLADNASNTIRGYMSIYRLNQEWGTSDNMFTIPTALRPSSNKTVTVMVKTSDGEWYPTTATCRSDGGIRQSLSQTCVACYGAFEYRI